MWGNRALSLYKNFLIDITETYSITELNNPFTTDIQTIGLFLSLNYIF